MGSMIADGTWIPNTTSEKTGVMSCSGKEGNIITYDLVKNCPFCGKELSIIKQ
jgi:hypothetical protein